MRRGRPIRVVDALVVVAKALLIAGLILFLAGYFGVHVREAGGSVAVRTYSSGTVRF